MISFSAQSLNGLSTRKPHIDMRDHAFVDGIVMGGGRWIACSSGSFPRGSPTCPRFTPRIGTFVQCTSSAARRMSPVSAEDDDDFGIVVDLGGRFRESWSPDVVDDRNLEPSATQLVHRLGNHSAALTQPGMRHDNSTPLQNHTPPFQPRTRGPPPVGAPVLLLHPS